MFFPGFRLDMARQARIIHLSPAEAVRTLFRGDWGIGDEAALGFAIRKDPRVTLDDEAILDVYFELMDDLVDETGDERVEALDHVEPDAFLDDLAAASTQKRHRRRA